MTGSVDIPAYLLNPWFNTGEKKALNNLASYINDTIIVPALEVVDEISQPVAANVVLAGPTTGADAAPTFRALVSADVPPIGVTELSDYYSYYDPENIPVGSVLFYNPIDGVYPDTLPQIANYANDGGTTHNKSESQYPVRIVNTGLNALNIIVNTTYWPIGMEMEVIQASATKIQFSIGNEASIVLQAYNRAGTSVGSVTGSYSPYFRTTGLDAEATIKRINTTRYIIRGDLELA